MFLFVKIYSLGIEVTYRVARQGLPCYTAVAQLGFKRHTTAMLKSNLIQSIEIGTAVARCLKSALGFYMY